MFLAKSHGWAVVDWLEIFEEYFQVWLPTDRVKLVDILKVEHWSSEGRFREKGEWLVSLGETERCILLKVSFSIFVPGQFKVYLS